MFQVTTSKGSTPADISFIGFLEELDLLDKF